MALAVDILQLFPDLAAIDRAQLQTYCDEWLQRPIARDRGVAQITVATTCTHNAVSWCYPVLVTFGRKSGLPD